MTRRHSNNLRCCTVKRRSKRIRNLQPTRITQLSKLQEQKQLSQTDCKQNKETAAWQWLGDPVQIAISLNDSQNFQYHNSYSRIRHEKGEEIGIHDYVSLKPSKCDELSYIGKVQMFWEHSQTGEKMMSLLWYYRPEQTPEGRNENDKSYEIFSSCHYDNASVACIEYKCHVMHIPNSKYWNPKLDPLYFERKQPAKVVFFSRFHYDMYNKIVRRENL